ncbi:SAPC2 protein, partial [Atractosteus spatula]|nr:SAPC2 protein [Atractosteus spatula]
MDTDPFTVTPPAGKLDNLPHPSSSPALPLSTPWERQRIGCPLPLLHLPRFCATLRGTDFFIHCSPRLRRASDGTDTRAQRDSAPSQLWRVQSVKGCFACDAGKIRLSCSSGQGGWPEGGCTVAMVMASCGCEGAGLAGLRCEDPGHVMRAVEALVSAVQEAGEGEVERILQDPDSDDCINGLCGLLQSLDSRLCSNAAYLVGLLAESEAGLRRLLAQGDSSSLMGALLALLHHHDPETVTNAAGAIATLAESGAGQQCVLGDGVFGELLSSVSALLEAASGWTVSNAALVVARLSQSDDGGRKLLAHPCAPHLLRQLTRCLAHDRAGCGVNAAFALGRLCDCEEGRCHVLTLAQEHDLVGALLALLAQGDPGGGKNACFALSCLATDKEGHAHILQNPALPKLMESLQRLLQVEDEDSVWFAAVAVKVLLSRPRGVLAVREHRALEDRLQALSCSDSIGKEVLEEVNTCLKKLQRISKPFPPKTKPLNSGSYLIYWERTQLESGLEVTYSLLDGERVLYHGPQCRFTLDLSALEASHTLTLRLVQSTAGGDVSPCSEPTLLAVEKEWEEPAPPGPPLDLRVAGSTATQVKLSWAPPAGGPAPKAYQLYRGATLLETLTELSCITGGLSPGATYQFGVCAVGPGGKLGEQATVQAWTTDPQDHAPSRLTVTVLGRHELLVTWDVPTVPLGKLFNYELSINGRVVYLGTERSHAARRLSASTEYTCTVTAITSGGRCESRPVTKRTARDESLYSPARPSHPPLPCGPPPPLPSKEATDVGDRVALGTVCGYDVISAWQSLRALSRGGAPAKPQPPPLLPRRAKTESELLPRRQQLATGQRAAPEPRDSIWRREASLCVPPLAPQPGSVPETPPRPQETLQTLPEPGPARCVQNLRQIQLELSSARETHVRCVKGAGAAVVSSPRWQYQCESSRGRSSPSAAHGMHEEVLAGRSAFVSGALCRLKGFGHLKFPEPIRELMRSLARWSIWDCPGSMMRWLKSTRACGSSAAVFFLQRALHRRLPCSLQWSLLLSLGAGSVCSYAVTRSETQKCSDLWIYLETGEQPSGRTGEHFQLANVQTSRDTIRRNTRRIQSLRAENRQKFQRLAQAQQADRAVIVQACRSRKRSRLSLQGSRLEDVLERLNKQLYGLVNKYNAQSFQSQQREQQLGQLREKLHTLDLHSTPGPALLQDIQRVRLLENNIEKMNIKVGAAERIQDMYEDIKEHLQESVCLSQELRGLPQTLEELRAVICARDTELDHVAQISQHAVATVEVTKRELWQLEQQFLQERQAREQELAERKGTSPVGGKGQPRDPGERAPGQRQVRGEPRGLRAAGRQMRSLTLLLLSQDRKGVKGGLPVGPDPSAASRGEGRALAHSSTRERSRPHKPGSVQGLTQTVKQRAASESAETLPENWDKSVSNTKRQEKASHLVLRPRSVVSQFCVFAPGGQLPVPQAPRELSARLATDIESLREALSCTDLQVLESRILSQQSRQEHLLSWVQQCQEKVEAYRASLASLEGQHAQLKFSAGPSAASFERVRAELEAGLEGQRERCGQGGARLAVAQRLLEEAEQGIDNLHCKLSCVALPGKEAQEDASLDALQKLQQLHAKLMALQDLVGTTAMPGSQDTDKLWAFLEHSTLEEPRTCRLPLHALCSPLSEDSFQFLSPEEDCSLSREEIKRQGRQLLEAHNPAKKKPQKGAQKRLKACFYGNGLEIKHSWKRGCVAQAPSGCWVIAGSESLDHLGHRELLGATPGAALPSFPMAVEPTAQARVHRETASTAAVHQLISPPPPYPTGTAETKVPLSPAEKSLSSPASLLLIRTLDAVPGQGSGFPLSRCWRRGRCGHSLQPADSQLSTPCVSEPVPALETRDPSPPLLPPAQTALPVEKGSNKGRFQTRGGRAKPPKIKPLFTFRFRQSACAALRRRPIRGRARDGSGDVIRAVLLQKKSPGSSLQPEREAEAESCREEAVIISSASSVRDRTGPDRTIPDAPGCFMALTAADSTCKLTGPVAACSRLGGAGGPGSLAMQPAEPGFSTDGLPRAFLQSLRTLFDILDDDRRGYVHVSEIESRWQGADTRELPGGVLECLRRVAPPHGCLTFERFVAGLRFSLLSPDADSLRPQPGAQQPPPKLQPGHPLSQPSCRGADNAPPPGKARPLAPSNGVNTQPGRPRHPKDPHGVYPPTCAPPKDLPGYPASTAAAPGGPVRYGKGAHEKTGRSLERIPVLPESGPYRPETGRASKQQLHQQQNRVRSIESLALESPQLQKGDSLAVRVSAPAAVLVPSWQRCPLTLECPESRGSAVRG